MAKPNKSIAKPDQAKGRGKAKVIIDRDSEQERRASLLRQTISEVKQGQRKPRSPREFTDSVAARQRTDKKKRGSI